MKIEWVLIESQITGRFGHYYNYIQSLLAVVDCQKVYAPSNCDIEEPLFRRILTPYSPKWFAGTVQAKLTSVLYQARMSHKRLQEVQTIVDGLDSNSEHVVVWLTVDDFELVSFLLVRMPANVSFFGICHMKVQSRYAKIALVLLKGAKLLRYSRKTIGCNTKAIGEYIQSFAGDGLHTAVVPYPFQSPKLLDLPDGVKQFITFLGDARSEKGFSLLLDCVDTLAQKSEMFIQCNSTPGLLKKPEEVALATRLEETRRKAATDKHIHWRDSVLSDAEYYRVLDSSKLVLLPYLAKRYEGRVSGILGEALLQGVPVVVSPGTWLAEQIETYGGGVIMTEYTPQALLLAVDIILAADKHFSAAARKAGEDFYAKNNASRLKEVIESSVNS
jgi:glycosyltransferase involved in cell wall biosynthesis